MSRNFYLSGRFGLHWGVQFKICLLLGCLVGLKNGGLATGNRKIVYFSTISKSEECHKLPVSRYKQCVDFVVYGTIDYARVYINRGSSTEWVIRWNERKQCGTLGCTTNIVSMVGARAIVLKPTLITSGRTIYYCRSGKQTGLRFFIGNSFGKCFIFYP